MPKDLQGFKGPYKSSPVTVTHLSESGGTFIEARLTWVRLNAELKNWRKVGRESLAFLEKKENMKVLEMRKKRRGGGEEGRAGQPALKMDHNQAVRQKNERR